MFLRLSWIVLGCMIAMGAGILGIMGVPVKPVMVIKIVPDDKLPQ